MTFPARASSTGRGHATVIGTLVFAALSGVLASGCLPSGSRGEGSGIGVGQSNQVAVTPSPSPTGPTPRPSFVMPTPTPAPTFFVYVVAKGDSLNTIAHRFGTTARSIAFWNRATYPSLDPESAKYRPGLVKVGWTLFLIPNVEVDEQELPEPSTSTDPNDAGAAPSDDPDAAPSDDADAEPNDDVEAEPSESAIPE